jgi:transposase
VTAKIQAADYPYEVEVPAEVVGVRNALMAVKFLGSAGPVLDLGRWLAARNQPVAPLPDSSELVTRLKQMRCSTSIPRWSTPRDREAALEFAYAKTQVGTSHGR